VKDHRRRLTRHCRELAQREKEDVEEVRVLRHGGVLVAQQQPALRCLANPREIDVTVVHAPDEALELMSLQGLAGPGQTDRPKIRQRGQRHDKYRPGQYEDDLAPGHQALAMVRLLFGSRQVHP